MADNDIAPPEELRKPFKRCTECGIEYKHVCYGLINRYDYSDTRRHDVCNWCRFPETARTYKPKTIYYESQAGADTMAAARVAAAAKRRTRLLSCQPPWADLAKIKLIYAQAQRISRKTGVPHEVDHIIPIINPLVCGLHIPLNLQVIPKFINRRKSNGFLPLEIKA